MNPEMEDQVMEPSLGNMTRDCTDGSEMKGSSVEISDDSPFEHTACPAVQADVSADVASSMDMEASLMSHDPLHRMKNKEGEREEMMREFARMGLLDEQHNAIPKGNDSQTAALTMPNELPVADVPPPANLQGVTKFYDLSPPPTRVPALMNAEQNSVPRTHTEASSSWINLATERSENVTPCADESRKGTLVRPLP